MSGDPSDPFGMMLKQFRKRRHLTQQQLATTLGVHRTTLIRWEQGDFLPESKAIVLELARHLLLSDQEVRCLLEASLTTLAPLFLVPLPRNPFFTGREAILEALHIQLETDRAATLTQSSALHGLGGVGKTQIALEYAYRHALEYRAIFWIGAETEEQIVTSLFRMAEVLQVPAYGSKNQQHVLASVQRWLETHQHWLLIWDNVEQLELLDRFLPPVRPGSILITTRSPALGIYARSLNLLPMEQEEGMLFLLRRIKVLAPSAPIEQMDQIATQMPAQYTAASALVSALGGLPLALDQAGAYLEEAQCSVSTYLDLFHTQSATLLSLRGARERTHPDSVATTLALAITRAATRHPVVLDVLRVCAMLSPDGLPEELFRQGARYLGTALERVCGDTLVWNQVLAAACAYSLLSRQPENQTLSIHRLVQAVLLASMDKVDRSLWNLRVIEALDDLFPEPSSSMDMDDTLKNQCDRLLPHALHCLRQIPGSLSVASLAYKTARVLHRRGQYTEAEGLYLRALSIREQMLGPSNLDVASSLQYLALLYFHQGRYIEVEPLCMRALQIREQRQGSDHPDVAHVLSNLANLYWVQLRYAEAEHLCLRAIRIGEQSQIPDHPDMARSLESLSLLCVEQGRYEEAEALFLRVLHIREQRLSPDHVQVATSLGNLGALYFEQGRYGEAEPLYLRALQIREQEQGPDHPNVAYTLNNLAELYQAQGRYEEAETLYLRAVQVREQHLRVDHPLLINPLNGLADLYQTQERDEEAERLYQRALAIGEQQLGLHHLKTTNTLHGLALLRKKQRRFGEARALAERVLTIRSSALGEAHPSTARARTFLAQFAQEQG